MASRRARLCLRFTSSGWAATALSGPLTLPDHFPSARARTPGNLPPRNPSCHRRSPDAVWRSRRGTVRVASAELRALPARASACRRARAPARIERRLPPDDPLARAGCLRAPRATPEEGFGITNLIPRPTPGIDTLEPSEYVAGERTLRRKVRRWKPEVVGFVGVTLFRAVFHRWAGERVSLGAQPETFEGARVFVLSNPRAKCELFLSRDARSVQGVASGYGPRACIVAWPSETEAVVESGALVTPVPTASSHQRRCDPED